MIVILLRCSQFIVLFFIFLWTPAVLVSTGRWRFRYSLEPTCELVLPSDLLGTDLFGPGGSMPPNVDDFLGVTAKRLPVGAVALRGCHAANVESATWDSELGCTLMIRSAGDSGENNITLVRMPMEVEAGFVDRENCEMASHPRSSLHWIHEDFCAAPKGGTGDGGHRAHHNATSCLDGGGVWVSGAPAAISRWFHGHVMGASSVFAHSAIGSAYFLLGLVNFEWNGKTCEGSQRRLHRRVGYAFAATNVLVWLCTWGVIFGVSGKSVLRLLANSTGQFYWLYALWRGIDAARHGNVAMHRRWMLRNYSVAFSIILGRLFGTIVLVNGGLGIWPSFEEFEKVNIVFAWIWTFAALELFMTHGDPYGRHLELQQHEQLSSCISHSHKQD